MPGGPCMIPTLGEIERTINYDDNDEGRTIKFSDNSYAVAWYEGGRVHEWLLTRRSDNRFVLEYIDDSRRDPDMRGAHVQQYSLRDYELAFQKRGSEDIDADMRAMLLCVKERLSFVNYLNVDQVCGWIVQLSLDTDAGEPATFRDFYELEAELRRLLSDAQELYATEL